MRAYLAIALIMAALFSGCISTSTKVPATYDDKEYKAWNIGALELNLADIKSVESALKNNDMDAVKKWGGTLRENSQKNLDKMDTFEISPGLKPSYEEVREAFKSMNLAGRSYESGYYQEGQDYIKQANSHMDRAIALLKN